MEYTEKEKEVIEVAKKTASKKYGSIMCLEIKDVEIMLNLIEKQQKEIERLQNKDKEYIKIENNNLEWQKKYNELKNDSIPKDKIIGKIKILLQKLDEPNNDRWEKDDEAYYNNIKSQIKILKELLGE